ncbi:DUF1648 domain-containing protein [Paenibacillus tuaregi]|uniref:DUF1648 domain-containing protein n=1 Tax=Paenibacillus tuaregi TaxID=1816681 RepID=UPI0008381BCC|nr:DUF1648 domain-containing protein [Paenibacillus tuaregi]
MIKWLFHSNTLVSILVLSLLLSLIAVGLCPTNIPIHFNGGQADRFVNKYLGLFLFPVLMILGLALHKMKYKAAWTVYICFALHLYLLYNALI